MADLNLPRLTRRGGAAAIAATALAAQPARAQPAGLEMAEMTWPALRDAIAAGRRTAILPSGGVEQNGPHMILGKHDHIVRAGALRVAAALGDALVAPVLPYAPQGRFDPPEGNLRFPGTLGVTEDAFAALLDGVARSTPNGGARARASSRSTDGTARSPSRMPGCGRRVRPTPPLAPMRASATPRNCSPCIPPASTCRACRPTPPRCPRWGRPEIPRAPPPRAGKRCWPCAWPPRWRRSARHAGPDAQGARRRLTAYRHPCGGPPRCPW